MTIKHHSDKCNYCGSTESDQFFDDRTVLCEDCHNKRGSYWEALQGLSNRNLICTRIDQVTSERNQTNIWTFVCIAIMAFGVFFSWIIVLGAIIGIFTSVSKANRRSEKIDGLKAGVYK